MDNNTKLNNLIEQRDILLKKYGNVSFPNKVKLQQFIETNKTELSRLKSLQEEIRTLNFEIMTDFEKDTYLKEQKEIREKHSEE